MPRLVATRDLKPLVPWRPPTMSRIVDALQAAGLARRSLNEHDRRAVLIEATGKRERRAQARTPPQSEVPGFLSLPAQLRGASRPGAGPGRNPEGLEPTAAKPASSRRAPR